MQATDSRLTTGRFVALAWKDPNNITEELTPKLDKPS